MSIENTRKKLRNAKGKRLYEKTILEYSREIILELENAPSLLPDLLKELELDEDDFFSYISGNQQANITLYDQTLCLIRKKTSKKPF